MAIAPRALAAALAAGAVAAQTCPPLVVSAGAAANVVAPYFASWNVDPSRNRLFFDVNWTDPQLVYLGSQVGGANIRFGGTGADFLYYDVGGAPACGKRTDTYECLNATWLGALASLATSSNSQLVFGLNIHPHDASSPPKGAWNSTNAAALLRVAKAAGVPLAHLELGNEQNTIMTAEQQAGAFKVLDGVLDGLWGPPGSPGRPALVGPDIHSFRVTTGNDRALNFLHDFTVSAGPIMGAITHHEYIEIDNVSVLNATFLDQTATIGRQVMAAVRKASATVEVWAGEVGPHNGDTVVPGYPWISNCSSNHVCGRFGSTLWYADAMGAKAAVGYSAFCRQDLVGADYALINATAGYGVPGFVPSTDYWLLALWRVLHVGRTVLAVAKPPTAGVRAYAFCGAPQAAAAATNGSGSSSSSAGTPPATLVLINIGAAPACVGAPAFADPSAAMTAFTLTPGAGGVESPVALLNGVPLAVGSDGKLPAFAGSPVAAGAGVTLPPLSVTLLQVPLAPGAAPACE